MIRNGRVVLRFVLLKISWGDLLFSFSVMGIMLWVVVIWIWMLVVIDLVKLMCCIFECLVSVVFVFVFKFGIMLSILFGNLVVLVRFVKVRVVR